MAPLPFRPTLDADRSDVRLLHVRRLYPRIISKLPVLKYLLVSLLYVGCILTLPGGFVGAGMSLDEIDDFALLDRENLHVQRACG
jgi:hypothetical protein